jgi:hypothetical protein
VLVIGMVSLLRGIAFVLLISLSYLLGLVSACDPSLH